MSDAPESSRTSLNAHIGTPVGDAAHLPTAYRNKMLRRGSRAGLTPEPTAPSASSASLVTNMSSKDKEPAPQGNVIRRKLSTILTGGGGARKERPQSISSTSTSTERDASMRRDGMETLLIYFCRTVEPGISQLKFIVALHEPTV